MDKKLILKNVPNLLSWYRIVATPVILWSVYGHYRDLFFVLVMVNLVTDILDGLIARTFKLETDYGAKLDSTADMLTYISAVIGFIVFEFSFLQVFAVWFIALVGLYLLAQLAAVVKFGRNTHYHLYSNKITGYLQGVFLLLYYLESCPLSYFYFMVVFSCLAYLESLMVTICIPQLRSNVKGIYFMIKEHGSIK